MKCVQSKFALIVIGIAALGSGGCNYDGVGQLSVMDEATAQADDRSTFDLTGTFDRYLTREDRGVYTFTAYQKVKARQKFGQYHRNYKKDAQFVQAELRVRVNKAGAVVGQPRLLLRQGNRILTDGLLEGEVSVATQQNRMTISGDGLSWQYGDASTHVASFSLTVHNVVIAPPPTET